MEILKNFSTDNKKKKHQSREPAEVLTDTETSQVLSVNTIFYDVENQIFVIVPDHKITFCLTFLNAWITYVNIYTHLQIY